MAALLFALPTHHPKQEKELPIRLNRILLKNIPNEKYKFGKEIVFLPKIDKRKIYKYVICK
jgi:hypothetical protein